MAKAQKKIERVTKTLGVHRHGQEFGGTRPQLVVVKDNTTTANVKESKSQRKTMLDEAKKVIIAGSCVIGSAYFDLGEAFQKISDRNLFKDDGKKTFKEFCQAVEYSYQTVLNLMAVAENLTREQAKQFGPTLSYAIARASSKEAKDKLITMAGAGANTREVTEASKELRRAEGKGRYRDPKTDSSPSKPSEASKAKVVKVKTKKASKAVKSDLSNGDGAEEFDEKVAEVAKGLFDCKQCKGCLVGSFEADSLEVSISINIKTKKASYEVKLG